MTATLDSVPWSELQDAYGAATEVPKLLDRVQNSKGRKRFLALDELCSHVLHQGTIYSASAPVARWVAEQAKQAGPEETLMYYELLMGFAQAARQSFSDGRFIPRHSGGDPEHGREIRQAILDARVQFSRDLHHALPGIRAAAGDLLTAFEDSEAIAVRLVQERYFLERDAHVRSAWLVGLARAHGQVDDWDTFLETALAHENQAESRYILRQAQVMRAKSASDGPMVDELVETFSGDEGFYRAIRELGSERELNAMLEALKLASEEDVIRTLAERLLRQVFGDQRTGWGSVSYSLLREDGSKPPQPDLFKGTAKLIGKLILWRIFPFIRRHQIRNASRGKTKGINKTEYWGVKGDAPVIGQKLTEPQRRVLLALAAKPELWEFRTNLWSLFGLPDSANGLNAFVEVRH
jgi:hypothetical protein